MPTTYTDQFFVIDPYAPPPVGTNLVVQNFTYIDTNDDGVIDPPSGDSINGSDVNAVYHGDTVTISPAGGGPNITYTGATFYLANGTQVFSPVDGSVMVSGMFVSSSYVNGSTSATVVELGPPCFTPGTMIRTEHGDRLIETLKPGDKIKTRDNGLQTLKWIGRQSVPSRGHLAPIKFCKGAIGNNRDLVVSPLHRVLLTGWQAQLYFGLDEVLISAKHLVNGDTIFAQAGRTIEYIHLLFDDHEIIISNGVPTESYFPGHAAERQEIEVQQELADIFPEFAGEENTEWQLVRPEVKKFEAALITVGL